MKNLQQVIGTSFENASILNASIRTDMTQALIGCVLQLPLHSFGRTVEWPCELATAR